MQNAGEARRAVSYTRYPPDGVRGVAGTQRASRYGAVPDYFRQAATELCVIVQIETIEALNQLDAIATVGGVDAIFIGPGDLSASMGHLGDIGNAAVQEKLASAAERCQLLGKPCGIVGPNPDMVARFLDYGYSWVALGSDLSLMTGRAREWLGRLKGDEATTAAAAAAAKSRDSY